MVSDDHIRQALAQLAAGDILLLDFEIPQPQVMFALQLGRAAGAITVLNPAPFFTRDAFVIDYLHLVDVIVPNKMESAVAPGSVNPTILMNWRAGCWATGSGRLS